MVHECEHFYETGRKCHRITRRGEALCPGHRPAPHRSVHDEPAFRREIATLVEHLRAAGDYDLLTTLQDALTAIQPTIERKVSRARYLPFARASVVVGIALERVILAQRRRSAAAADAAQQQRCGSR
jgi:hypothetical protein